mmetsp:Transcript_42136/g.112397  ORF Transcript_42136/g.112397 Transcript_42136/m.112397 type:complete len:169 (-) Transcript_42136:621-1127(-)
MVFNHSVVGPDGKGPIRAGNSTSSGPNGATGDTCTSVGSTYFWDGYEQYRCMSKYVSTDDGSYTNLRSTISNTAWVTTQMINNPSSQTVESDIERTESNTATASWAISNTIELGYSYEVSVGVPAVFDATSSFDASFSTNVASTTETSEEQSWSNSISVVQHPAGVLE